MRNVKILSEEDIRNIIKEYKKIMEKKIGRLRGRIDLLERKNEK